MSALRSLALGLITFAFVAQAHAQPVMYRTAVAAGEATPTGGSFSVRFPTTFNDGELKAEDPVAPTLIVHLLSGITSDGIRFTASETPMPEQPPPIDRFMEATRNRPGAVVSEVSHEQSDGTNILSFSLTEPKASIYFRLLRTKAVQYMLVVQFPEALRDRATTMKDEYFASFKMIRP